MLEQRHCSFLEHLRTTGNANSSTAFARSAAKSMDPDILVEASYEVTSRTLLNRDLPKVKTWLWAVPLRRDLLLARSFFSKPIFREIYISNEIYF